MARSSVFYNCFLRLFGNEGFSGPEPPDGGCDDCGGGCTGEGCGCIDCDPGDDPCDDLVTLATCPENNEGPCIDRVYSKQTLVDRNCIVTCEDPVLPDCESCELGFLPQDCEECCPDPPQFKECNGYYCANPDCQVSYTDGGCVAYFSYTIPDDQDCPATYNGARVYTTLQAALIGEACYNVSEPGPNDPGGGTGGGGGGGAGPPATGGTTPCTLYECNIVNEQVVIPGTPTTPATTFIDRECVAVTQTVAAWIAQFNITVTGQVSCELVKGYAAQYGYHPDLGTCEANCQDETISPGTGGGGGLSTDVWVCSSPNSGQCEKITVATQNIGNDGVLVSTGQQSYEDEATCVGSSECCQTQEFRFWRCDLTNNCGCVDDVVVNSCTTVSPPAGSYTSQAACEQSSDCCKDDVAGAVQTLASLYPFDTFGNPIGPTENICPTDNLIIQPTDVATLEGIGQDYDLTFESSNPAITFDDTNGEITIDNSLIADPFSFSNSFFKLGVARECCGGGNPITIDVLPASLVTVLDATDPACDTGGGGGPVICRVSYCNESDVCVTEFADVSQLTDRLGNDLSDCPDDGTIVNYQIDANTTLLATTGSVCIPACGGSGGGGGGGGPTTPQ